jgi:pimeloyl-ACP methyl ester carboxylesterase
LDHPNIHICDIHPAFIDMPGISHGANYTGRELSAPPPAYDARKVADTVVRVSRHLKATTTVGATADLVRFGHFFAPNLSARFMNWFMTTYFKQAGPTAVTDGNLYALSSPGNVRSAAIVWGRQDKLCFPGQAILAQTAFPSCRLRWFDACGHFPIWDQPSLAVKFILECLDQERNGGEQRASMQQEI